MITEITFQLTNVKLIQQNHRTKICKVIKNQIFTVHNRIKHHLIGNIYHSRYTNEIIDNNKIIEL
jgi:hypothetical protein